MSNIDITAESESNIIYAGFTGPEEAKPAGMSMNWVVYPATKEGRQKAVEDGYNALSIYQFSAPLEKEASRSRLPGRSVRRPPYPPGVRERRRISASPHRRVRATLVRRRPACRFLPRYRRIPAHTWRQTRWGCPPGMGTCPTLRHPWPPKFLLICAAQGWRAVAPGPLGANRGRGGEMETGQICTRTVCTMPGADLVQKKGRIYMQPLKFLVGHQGLEPRTN